MKVGIISDTHDDIANIKKAVEIFKKRKIQTVLHLGDVVAPPAIKFFKGFKLMGIFGNNDGYKQYLLSTYDAIGGKLLGDFAVIELDGLKIALYHGEFEDITEALVKSSKYDLVLSGHFHKARIERFDNTIWVNPGSAHSYFTVDRNPTVAVLDTASREVEIVAIENDREA